MPDLSHLPTVLLVLFVVFGLAIAALSYICWIWIPRVPDSVGYMHRLGPALTRVEIRGDDWLAVDPPRWDFPPLWTLPVQNGRAVPVALTRPQFSTPVHREVNRPDSAQ